MTREQVKAMLPDGTDDAVVTKILDALHSEIQPHKDAAKKSADDLTAKARAFDELQMKYNTDIKAAQDRADALAFDGMLETVLRGKGARNIKAARALLDIDALKASKDRQKDMAEAVDKLVKAEDSAFLFEAQPTGGKGDIGAPAGKPSAVSGVEQAFMARNPGLKV